MMTKAEKRRLRQMAQVAIDSHEAMLDALHCQQSKQRGSDGHFYEIIPQEWQSDAKRIKRDIEAWKKLVEKYGRDDDGS